MRSPAPTPAAIRSGDASWYSVVLARSALRRRDHRVHFFGRRLLAMRGTGCARDAFIHQRTAQVVASGVQARDDAFVPIFTQDA
jgi:hypothetical protein